MPARSPASYLIPGLVAWEMSRPGQMISGARPSVSSPSPDTAIFIRSSRDLRVVSISTSHSSLIKLNKLWSRDTRHRRDNEWMYTIVIIHNSLIKSSSDSELPVMNPIRVMCGLGLISSSELLLFPLVAALLWSLIETRRSQEGAITPVTPSTISSQAAQCTTHRTDLISGLWSCPTLII